MNSRLSLLLVAVLLASACSSTAPTESGTAFGNDMVLGADETVPIATVLATPEDYAGKTVRVSGTVRSVCAKKGCWLRLADGDAAEEVFVKFTCPIEGRLIPLEAAGKEAVVEGTIEVTEISEEEARHYREDAGATPEEIAKVVGPQRTIRIQSPAAVIEGL